MREEIDNMLVRCGGVASREMFRRLGLARSALDEEIRQGYLVRLFPRVYGRPWVVDDVALLERAAVISIGAPVALSHLSALRSWGLRNPAPADVYVTVEHSRSLARHRGLVVHRTRIWPPCARRNGLLTVAPAHAVASSWPLVAGPDQREPAIIATRQRLITAKDLQVATDRLPRLKGRRELLTLTELLAAGCESELEIWGYLGVFDVPGLNHAVRQKVIRVGGRAYRLDLAYEEERVAIELDGHRYHSTREQRERDMRKDAALATIDWMTLRYSHMRLHRDIPGCRRDTLATLAARRRL